MRRLKRILSEKIAAFCGHSTLHGVYYLQSSSWALRVIWAAIMGAGVALGAVLGHMIWKKYSIDPTVTVVESTYYRSERVPFPAVMICDPQPIYGPQTEDITHILSSRGYNDTEINQFYNGFLDIHNIAYHPPLYIKKMHYLLQDLGFTLEVLLEMFKKPCDVIIVDCMWRSKRYNCTDMFREAVTVVGHCCQFDIAYFRQFSPKNTTFMPGKEPSEGLDITVNGVKVSPNGTTTNGTVLLYIFDAGNEITMMDGSISVADSSYFDVELEVFVIDSSSDVKGLSLKRRKCVLSTDKGIGASFYNKCFAMLMMRRVVNYCKCLPFRYSADELAVSDYLNCTWERYLCIYSQLDSTFADIHSLIQTNDCYQNCDYVEYESKVDFIRREVKTGLENDSHSRLAIHYASSTCLKYRRELIYTWDQMLANLGGIFGLCLGGSIISIIEIVWFLIDLLLTTLLNYPRKTKLQPMEKHIAFVTEKRDAKKTDKNKDGCYKFVN